MLTVRLVRIIHVEQTLTWTECVRQRPRPPRLPDHRSCGPALVWRRRASGSIDERRDLELVGLGIDFGVNKDRCDALRDVVKRVSVTRPSFSCRGIDQLPVADGRSDLAGKASESFPGAWYPPSSICWERKAKFSLGSEQMASWLSGYSCGVQHNRCLHGCSAKGHSRNFGHSLEARAMS